MNPDTSEFHIRALVRELMTDEAADNLLADTAWLDAKTNAYLEQVGVVDDLQLRERESQEFNAELELELRDKYPTKSFNEPAASS